MQTQLKNQKQIEHLIVNTEEHSHTYGADAPEVDKMDAHVELALRFLDAGQLGRARRSAIAAARAVAGEFWTDLL